MQDRIQWLDDPEIFQVNREPAHSDHFFYQNEEEWKTEDTRLVRSLNGIWKFCYSVNAGERPAEFYREDYDLSGFDEIRVPGHIELAGYDKIHYINTMYPWEGHYYRRPAYTLEDSMPGKGSFSKADYNPVGSYATRFDLDPAFLGKRVSICFEGVEQAMYLWVNGQFVGYAEDSFTPSEFDLTPFLRETDNYLAVEVHKRSTAAYLEDQDFFRFFGIFRNVLLLAKPKMHVEDLWIKPMLYGEKEGALALDMKVSMPEEALGRAEVLLLDDGKELLKHTFLLPGDMRSAGIGKPESKEEAVFYRTVFCQMEEKKTGEVIPWNHRRAKLYQVVVRLYDAEEELVELVPYEVGFRRLEIIDRVIYLNGERLILNGVNRHEWNAECGRAIGRDDMEKDMQILLRNNINAVRTCHYPDQKAWYYLCDSNGIYLMSETNLESHGSWQKLGGAEPSWNIPGSFPKWKAAVMDRAESNFETFKNHTAVLFWSLGNESFAGDNLAAMNAYFKQKKDGRLVHYEGVVWNRAYEEVISDVESRMYARPQDVRAYLEQEPKKPFILCEYMHDMGNSLGGMGSYIALLDEFSMYQGGFIWDYMDQAIAVTDPVTGKKCMRYGGDFDDRPADYEFSGNGIVFADRTEKPAMQEVRYYYGLYK